MCVCVCVCVCVPVILMESTLAEVKSLSADLVELSRKLSDV